MGRRITIDMLFQACQLSLLRQIPGTFQLQGLQI